MKIKRTILAVLATTLAVALSTPAAAQERGRMQGQRMMGMGMMGGGMGMILPPPVKGYSQGEEIFFIHTEVSDEEIATLLSHMMGSPVLFTPQLADVPAKLRIPVYVFTNGVKDGGPLGYQRDVLPHPPSWRKTGRYSPLRQIHKATWKDPARAEVLKSAEAIREARARGLITIEETSIVINAPMIAWPLGRR